MIGRRIESFLLLLCSFYRICRKLFLPFLFGKSLNAVESHAVELTHIESRAVGTDCRDGCLYRNHLTIVCCECRREHQVRSPSLTVAAETRCVVDHRFLVLIYHEVLQRLGEYGSEIDVTLRSPTFHELISGNDRIVLHTNVRPYALLPQRVVEVDENERLVRFRISETEDATSHSRSHLCLNAIILQHDTIITRSGFLLIVRETGAIALVRFLVCARVELYITDTRHEKEIAEVRNTRSTKMSKREALYGLAVPLVS